METFFVGLIFWLQTNFQQHCDKSDVIIIGPKPLISNTHPPPGFPPPLLAISVFFKTTSPSSTMSTTSQRLPSSSSGTSSTSVHRSPSLLLKVYISITHYHPKTPVCPEICHPPDHRKLVRTSHWPSSGILSN